MEIISSRTNQNVQYLKNLISDKKLRYSANLFVVEGATLVSDIPQTIVVESYFVCKSKAEKFIKKLQPGAKIFVLSDDVFEYAGDSVNPSGIIAICQIPLNKFDRQCNTVVLDNISDPGNLGTIIRTAVSAKFNNVLLLNCCDVFMPKVVRASMGGVFYANLNKVADASEIRELLNDTKLYALDMGGESIFNFACSLKVVALAVGSEAAGLSAEIKNISNKVLSLPMSGAVESLNAGVSISIGMYMLNFLNKN